MPKSKRARKTHVSKSKKQTKDTKTAKIQKIRGCFDKYAHAFVFRVHNMRTNAMNQIRTHFRDSTICLGKNKLMWFAVGRDEAAAVKKGTHQLIPYLRGHCGILFTNAAEKDVVSFLNDHRVPDFPRAGFRAAHQFDIPKGPLPQFSFSLEPRLRALGLPTVLVRGVIHLTKPRVVCQQGDQLTPEQCNILKLFGVQMTVFQVELLCMWSAESEFKSYKDPATLDAEDNDDESDEEDDKTELMTIDPVAPMEEDQPTRTKVKKEKTEATPSRRQTRSSTKGKAEPEESKDAADMTVDEVPLADILGPSAK